jgi:hypothetical protein
MASNKLTYQFALDGVTFDLSDKAPLPMKNKTGPQIVDIFNKMCDVARAVPDFDPKGDKTKPVNKFRDTETGKKRIAALHSSLVAFAKGQIDEARRAERAAAKAAPKANPAPAEAKAGDNGAAKRGRPTLENPSHRQLFEEYNALAGEAASLGIVDKRWKKHTSLFEKREHGLERIAALREVIRVVKSQKSAAA